MGSSKMQTRIEWTGGLRFRGDTAGRQIELNGEARAEGTRAETDPPRFTKLNLYLNVAGSGISATQVERAIALSKEKYCSVYHSLRTDIKTAVTLALV